MPPIDAPSLVDVLAELFAQSQQHAAGVHRKLSSGLHVKVAVKGQQRMVIVWRSGDRLPSAKECELVGEDAGFYDPKYRLWQCRESDEAFLITEGYRGKLCDHEWGFWMDADLPKATGHYKVCLHCGMTAKVLMPRRSKKAVYGYGKWELRQGVFERWLTRGPASDALVEQPHHQEPESSQPPVLEPAAAHQPQAAKPLDADALKLARELALKARLVAALLAIALRSACLSPWFARGFVIASRRAYLQGATLDELREECGGRWFRSNIRLAVPYVLLVARWRHLTRALPEQAAAVPVQPVKKARKSRKSKGVAAA